MNLKDKLQYLIEGTKSEIKHNGFVYGFRNTNDNFIVMKDGEGLIHENELEDKTPELYTFAEILTQDIDFGSHLLRLHEPIGSYNAGESVQLNCLLRQLGLKYVDTAAKDIMNKKIFEIIHW